MLQYRTIPVTAFQQNCSLIWCDQSLEAAVIDPGGDLARIKALAIPPAWTASPRERATSPRGSAISHISFASP